MIFSIFVFALTLTFAVAAAVLCDEALERFQRGEDSPHLVALSFTVSALGGGLAVLFVTYLFLYARP
jgi:hypothetical protein